MNIMSKRGDLTNVVTYEHFCDKVDDMKKIPYNQISLGSVCCVVHGETGVEFYIADSNKKWMIVKMDDVPDEPVDENALEEAFNSDEPNVTLKLNQPLTIDEPLVAEHGKNITIDLNDQNITVTGTLFNIQGGTVHIKGDGNITATGNIANVYNGGTIIIDGGTYDSTANNYGIGAIGAGSSIEFNNGSLTTTEGGLMAFDGGMITMNGGELNTRDNSAIGTNGTAGRGGNTIIMNGGEINAHITSAGYEAVGIYLPNDDTFIMNDGEIIVNNGAGIVQRGGLCSIRGGSITATGNGGTGWVGDNKTEMSESAVIYHQSANYPAKDTIRLVISGGTFIGTAHSVEILSNEENPNVTITGGSFTPPRE